jgi:hypothetical protein
VVVVVVTKFVFRLVKLRGRLGFKPGARFLCCGYLAPSFLKPTPNFMTTTKTDNFNQTLEQISKKAMDLSHSLRSAMDFAFPSVNGARACGRALGLKRQLGWQVYTISHASDYAIVLRSMPKQLGWKLVLNSLANKNCSASVLNHLRACIESLELQMNKVATDRSMLRAVTAGELGSAHQIKTMLRARAAAVRANEFIHGISVQTLLSAFMVGPAGANGVVDIATVTAFHGVKRSRASAAWPLYYTLECYDPQRSARGVFAKKYSRAKIGALVSDLSTPGVGNTCLRMRKDGQTNVVDLLDRGLDRSEAAHFCFLEHLKSAGSVGAKISQSHAMFLITTPIERAVVQVWLHKSVRIITDPSGSLVSSPNLNRRVMESNTVERLPLEAVAEMIHGPHLPASLRQYASSHQELLRRAAHKLRAPLSEFVAYQLDVANPPWMSMLVLSFDC